MSTKDHILTSSDSGDVHNVSFIDYVGDRTYKLYPYVAFRAEEAKAIIQADTTSIIGLSNSQSLLLENGIQTESDGSIEVFGMRNKEGRIDITAPDQAIGVTLKLEDEIEVITTQMQTKKRMKPIFCTIDEPYDQEKYSKGLQPVFILGTMRSAQDFNDDFDNLDIDNLSQVKLTNVTVLEQQFEFARMFFDTKASNVETVDKIKVRLPKSTLLKRIIGKGKEAEFNTDVDLISTTKLMPFKASIISTQDRVEIYADWWEYDTVLPYIIAQNFISGKDLQSLKTVQIGQGTARYPAITDDEITLINDILALTVVYSESFASIPRMQDATKSDYGRIDPSYTITSEKLSLQVLEGKDPIQVIDGLIDKYVRTHTITDPLNTNEESVQWKITKQLIVALSRFIYSTYAIGKGRSQFNEIMLPWFLSPANNKVELSLNKDTKLYTLAPVNFFLRSRYFDVKPDNIYLKETTNLSTTEVIQVDRKITLPFPTNRFTEINKLPLPGDVRTNANDDLKFIFYLPVDDDTTFRKTYLDQIMSEQSVDTTTSFLTRNADGILNKLTPEEKIKFITQEVYAAYGVPLSAITVLSSGDTLYSIQRYQTAAVNKIVKTVHFANGNQYWHGDVFDFWIGWVNINLTMNAIATDKAITPEYYYHSEQEVQAEILKQLTDQGVDMDLIDSYGVVGGRIIDGDKFIWDSLYVNVKREYWNAQIKITGLVNKLTLNRDIVFDKTKFKRTLASSIGIAGEAEIVLQDVNKQMISQVQELTISTLYADYFDITIGSLQYKIPAFNKDDETIAIQKVLFT